MAWTEDETKALLRIWADKKMQNQLEGQKRNKLGLLLHFWQQQTFHVCGNNAVSRLRI